MKESFYPLPRAAVYTRGVLVREPENLGLPYSPLL